MASTQILVSNNKQEMQCAKDRALFKLKIELNKQMTVTCSMQYAKHHCFSGIFSNKTAKNQQPKPIT